MKLLLHPLNAWEEDGVKHKRVSNILLFVIVASLILIPLLSTVPSSVGSNNGVVVVVKLDGVVNVAAFELVKEGLGEAHKLDAAAVVLLLDTQGGLLDATFDIVRLIEQASVPVIVFVYPTGATAWSAGTFIVLSSHVAAMAPYSLIGSCQPRSYPTGELLQDQKLTNSLTEFLVQRARMHGRNETVAAKFVTENLNVDAETARSHGVIEQVTSTVEELLESVHGMSVEVAGKGQVTVQTKNSQIRYLGPTIRVRVLRMISDPTIAYVLFILGVWGIIFGFLTVGFEGEIIGFIILILGLIGLGFYVDLFVIILLVVGGVLVFVEMREPGLQFFGPAGVFCLLAGSLLLLRLDPARWLISPEWYRLFMVIVVVPIGILGGFSIIVLYKLFESAKKRPAVLGFAGQVGRAIDEIGPDKEGFVRFHGEYWKARSNTHVNPGEKVRIVAKEGLILIVEPEKDNSRSPKQTANK